eukprot:jgi/Mesen1/367/ME000001S02674
MALLEAPLWSFTSSQLHRASPKQERFVHPSLGAGCCFPGSTSLGQLTGRKNASCRIQCATSSDVSSEGKAQSSGRKYFNITGFPFPLRPFLERQTIRYEVEAGRIWLFEQEQGLGFSSVTTNTRMTVIKLKSGGLWVHAPVAPTRECLRLLKDLGCPVEHIVLPTFAYEHKIFVGPFARKFPAAAVWTAPAQWSWPLNLPPPFFGIFPTGTLRDDLAPEEMPPWADEIAFKVLVSPEVGIGPYVEAAFFHRATRTLLVTDAVILVPPEPLEVVSQVALFQAAQNGLAVQVLSRGRDVPTEPVPDTPAARRTGWQRMVLQVLFFGPGDLLTPQASFSRVANRLLVSPVVRTLVFDKIPLQVREWVDSITAEWKFRQIIPCHYSAPIKAGPKEFRAAFSFLDGLLEEQPASPARPRFSLPSLPFFSSGPAAPAASFAEDDMKTLTGLDNFLVSVGAVKKSGT